MIDGSGGVRQKKNNCKYKYKYYYATIKNSLSDGGVFVRQRNTNTNTVLLQNSLNEIQ